MVADPMVEVETAIMARLGCATSAVSSDPTLAAAAPGGVYSRTAPPGTFPYITVRLVKMDEFSTMTRAYRWRFRYSIQAADQSDAIDAASAALDRVYQLLQDADDSMPMPDFRMGYARRQGRTSLSPKQQGLSFQQVTDEWLFEAYLP